MRFRYHVVVSVLCDVFIKQRVMVSCEKSGNKPDCHFAGTGKLIELGFGSSEGI